MTLIAHGLVSRSDLPIPEWLFGWAAAMVLVVSFVALAVLWPEPRVQEERWRPLRGGVGRLIAGRPVQILCGTIGVFLLGVVVYSGLRGTQSSTANFAPDVHLRDLLARAGARERAAGGRVQGVQPVAGRGQRGGLGGPNGSEDRPARAAGLPRAAGQLARCRGHLRLRRARARGLGRGQAREPRDCDARLFRVHVRGHGAVRRGSLDPPRRGVLRLLQPLLAALALRDARRRGRDPALPQRAPAPSSPWPARCRSSP